MAKMGYNEICAAKVKIQIRLFERAKITLYTPQWNKIKLVSTSGGGNILYQLVCFKKSVFTEDFRDT